MFSYHKDCMQETVTAEIEDYSDVSDWSDLDFGPRKVVVVNDQGKHGQRAWLEFKVTLDLSCIGVGDQDGSVLVKQNGQELSFAEAQKSEAPFCIFCYKEVSSDE